MTCPMLASIQAELDGGGPSIVCILRQVHTKSSIDGCDCHRQGRGIPMHWVQPWTSMAAHCRPCIGQTMHEIHIPAVTPSARLSQRDSRRGSPEFSWRDRSSVQSLSRLPSYCGVTLCNVHIITTTLTTSDAES